MTYISCDAVVGLATAVACYGVTQKASSKEAGKISCQRLLPREQVVMVDSSFSSSGEQVVLVSSSDENHPPQNIIDGLVVLLEDLTTSPRP